MRAWNDSIKIVLRETNFGFTLNYSTKTRVQKKINFERINYFLQKN